MTNPEQNESAKVFTSGKSQAVRLPKRFRFGKGCNEVSVRQIGRHLILSPCFEDWDDFWKNTERPDADFMQAIASRRDTEHTDAPRVTLD